MKRWLLTIALVVIAFFAGFFLAWKYVVISGMHHEREFRNSIKSLQQRIYGKNFYHLPQIDHESSKRLQSFDPARSAAFIRLSYSNCWGNDRSLTLNGNGQLISQIKKDSRLVTTIDRQQCKGIFQQFISSGLLNYAPEVIELKEDLPGRNSKKSVCDGTSVEIRITAPELNIDKSMDIYEPDCELENFPDIIEFQIFTRLEKTMLDCIPKDDPDWGNTH